MNKKYKGFIGLDLDGTVFNNEKQITIKTFNAIKDATKMGYLVIPVTGRPMNGVPYEFTKELKSEYVISANGASIYKRYDAADKDLNSGEKVLSFGDGNDYFCIYENPMEDEKVLEVLNALDEFDMVPDCFASGMGHMPIYAKEKIPKLGLAKSMERYILSKREYFPDLKEYVKKSKSKVEKITINFYLNEKGQKEKEKAYQTLLKIKDITVVSGAPHNLEVNKSTVGKGNAILYLCDYLGINREKTCACGDDINDIDMLSKVSFPVAMGNAVDKVKDMVILRGGMITASNENDGVMKAIKIFCENNN